MSMNVDFTTLPPMDGIDMLIKARAAGTITSDFADSMIKLLQGKIMEMRRLRVGTEGPVTRKQRQDA